MTSIWLREAPAAPVGARPATTDVAVIGGGVAGTSVALHLARHGVGVCLLEAGEISCRASGRNDGQLLLGLGEHYNRIHGQFGAAAAPVLWDFLADNHRALVEELRAGGIECGLEERGGLRLAETSHEFAELEQAAALLAAEHKPHELVPAADLPRWLPPARGFHGGLYLPGEAIVQPAAMVRGLAARAAAAGAVLCEQQRVLALRGEPGDYALELADGGILRAPVVVHCTSTLARELDPSGLLQRAVFPFRGQILASAPLPAALAGQFPPYAMSSNFCYEYFRLHGERFVIGGKRWSVPGEELGILDDSTHNPTVSDNLLAYAREHFPTLADVAFDTTWTGIMAGTPDGLPLCGALPGQPGVFALLGFNGYGLSFAFLAARCLAEMIVDGQSAHPALPMFAPRRLQSP
ncbi:MAG: FAD-binding oxidoreductase [Planctomycetes bacterium]|nr:FAD-binding oxidoreductase [Planctomycetota bacterium]